jgi:gamma-glutamyltranspeptidase
LKSINGADVGGVQSIMAIDGYYRAGSDFRKDGQAVGW